MTILFKCTSAYTVFISVVLSELYYSNDYRVLLISDTNKPLMNFIDSFKSTSIWDETVILNEGSFEKSDVEKQVFNILENYSIDIFHLFLYDLYSLTFMKYIPKKTKIILTEEGTMTYQPLKHYKEDFEKFKENKDLFQNINDLKMDWERIDEIFLFEPRLFDRSINKPVKKIDIEYLLKDYTKRNDLVNKLNKLFSYSLKKKDYEIVYFDTYLCNRNYISLDYEKYYLKNIIDIIRKYNYIIKLHPNEEKDFYKIRYNNITVNIESNSLVPWEVIYLNIIHYYPDKRLILISTCSTSMYNTQIIGKSVFNNIYIIYLSKITKDYLLDSKTLDFEINNIKRFKELSYNSKIYTPENFTEFRKIIDDIYNEKRTYVINYEENIELLWLRNEYLRRYNFFGNTITYTTLSIKNGNRIIRLYIDYSFREFEIKFDLSNIEISDSTEVLWKVFDISLYNKLLIKDIYFINQGNKKILNNKIILPNYARIGKWIDISSNNTLTIILSNTHNAKYLYINFFVDDLKNYSILVQENIMFERYFQYYDLLYKWLLIKQSNIKLSDYFVKNNYQNVAIYGNGKIGKRLLFDIQSDVNVICFITGEKKSFIDNDNIRVACIDDLQNNNICLDVIIVTPVYEFDSIKFSILNKFKNVVSIKEVIEDLLDIT